MNEAKFATFRDTFFIIRWLSSSLSTDDEKSCGHLYAPRRLWTFHSRLSRTSCPYEANGAYQRIWLFVINCIRLMIVISCHKIFVKILNNNVYSTQTGLTTSSKRFITPIRLLLEYYSKECKISARVYAIFALCNALQRIWSHLRCDAEEHLMMSNTLCRINFAILLIHIGPRTYARTHAYMHTYTHKWANTNTWTHIHK